MPCILLVDDSETVREELRQILEAEGFDVIGAEDGKAGFDLAAQRIDDIDLMVSDYHMPLQNGLDMLDEMRTKLNAKFQVLMLTTETSPELKQQAKELNVMGWVLKPVEGSKFLIAVKMAISRGKIA